MLSILSFLAITLAQSSTFKLAAENPSIGPYAINSYHVGAGLNYMATTSRDVNSGATFYFNGTYLTQQTPSNIPAGAFIGYVDIPTGADCGVVQIGVGATNSSLTSFTAIENLLALAGHTDRFYVCSAVSYSTNITSVVYSTSDDAPVNGGGVVDVDSCYHATIAQIFNNGTITSTSRNSTVTTSITRNGTFTHSPTITGTTTRHLTTTTLCPQCYTTLIPCPTCPGSSSVVTRTSTAVATTSRAPTSTVTQISSATKHEFSLVMLALAFFTL